MSRLIHDCAWTGGLHMKETVSRLQQTGKLDDLFIESYKIIRAALEAYDLLSDRTAMRLRPTKN